MIRRILLPLVFLVGCNRGASVQFCDHTSNLRLAFAVASPASRVLPGMQVLYENGTPYLFVDGTCTYWVTQGDNVWDDVRTGTLSSADEANISSDLYYSDWSRLHGDYPGTTQDGSGEIFSDGTNVVVCDSGCNISGTPGEVEAMRDRWKSWHDRLWSAGAPVSGPERAIVVQYESNPGMFIWGTWPLKQPIDTLAISEVEAQSLDYGKSTLISDPGDAEALRSLRRAFASGQGDQEMFAILVQQGANYYRVYARDTTPLEGSDGLVKIAP